MAGLSSSRGKAITLPGTSMCTRDGRLVLRWNLERHVTMKGRASRRLLELIAELVEEGLL